MFGEGLQKFLATQAPLTALLGTSRGDGTTGIFPAQAPDEPTIPYIAYVQVSGANVYSFAGPNRLTLTRYRIACWGSTYKEAKTLCNTLKQVLDGFRGIWTDGTKVENVIDTMEADTTDALPHGTLYGSHIDFDFVYQDNS